MKTIRRSKVELTKPLSPMKQFILDNMEPGEWQNSGPITRKWNEHKGNRIYGSSRDLFGSTGCTYKALYSLVALGLIAQRYDSWNVEFMKPIEQ